jgi:Skp family chaperone for outer membrane proteins
MSHILFAALWAPVLGIAQTASQPPADQPSAGIGPVKIAFVNLEQAVYSCDEGKREFGEVQKFVDSKNAELENLRKEVDSLRNQLNVQGSKLTDEARLDLEDQVEAKETALQRFQQDTQKEIEARRLRVGNYIGKRMLPVVEKLSKGKGLNAVFNVSSSRDLYLDPMFMITDEVIKLYNQTYPVKTSPAGILPKKP